MLTHAWWSSYSTHLYSLLLCQFSYCNSISSMPPLELLEVQLQQRPLFKNEILPLFDHENSTRKSHVTTQTEEVDVTTLDQAPGHNSVLPRS